VADAEQEQDDDQPERQAEKPEQDQDHLGPPSRLVKGKTPRPVQFSVREVATRVPHRDEERPPGRSLSDQR
jgi:hypothetical protein